MSNCEPYRLMCGPRLLRLCLLSLLLFFLQPTWAREPIVLNHRWEVEPDLGASWDYVPPRIPVMLDASRLTSTQRQIRLAEAQTAILKFARVEPESRQPALQAIIRQLQAGEENRQVLLAFASAAVTLSDGSEAELLWELLRGDAATRPVIERALQGWRKSAALDTWRSRLQDPSPATFELLIAIDGVAAVGDSSDAPALEALLRSDSTSIPLKFAVARALGSVVTQGMERFAEEILAADVEQRELLAAHVLARHSSPDAKRLQLAIVAGDNSAAQARVFATIAAYDLEQARELATRMITHPDSIVRLQAVDVLNQFDDEASLRLQALALADSNIDIRCTVRENLQHKAQLADLKVVIDEILSDLLVGDRFEGIEQSILLAAALGEKERCPRLVELLEHPRPDVSIRAAWALQELADSGEILDRILPHTQSYTDRLVNDKSIAEADVIRVSYLFECMGRNRFQPATEMLKLYIPKAEQKMRTTTRTSAIWALGKILQGSQDANISRLLAQRLLDNNPLEPEDDLVKFASAIALGYIGNPDSPERLEQAEDRPPFPVGLARQWALDRFANPPQQN